MAGGAGERAHYLNNWITPKCAVRENVSVADPESPLDVPNGVGEFDNRSSKRGANNVVFLYVVLNGDITAARINLWIDADAADVSPSYGPDATERCLEEEPGSSSLSSKSSSSKSSSSKSSSSSLIPSSSSSKICERSGNWCLVDYWDFDDCTSELLWFQHLPPGRFKVTISVIEGNGSISIKEQHTE